VLGINDKLFLGLVDMRGYFDIQNFRLAPTGHKAIAQYMIEV
jgi:hypothetical protein